MIRGRISCIKLAEQGSQRYWCSMVSWSNIVLIYLVEYVWKIGYCMVKQQLEGRLRLVSLRLRQVYEWSALSLLARIGHTDGEARQSPVYWWIPICLTLCNIEFCSHFRYLPALMWMQSPRISVFSLTFSHNTGYFHCALYCHSATWYVGVLSF